MVPPGTGPGNYLNTQHTAGILLKYEITPIKIEQRL